MRQVHLSTAVLLMFAASLLLALNLAGTTINYYGKPSTISGKARPSFACGSCDVRGFPLPMSDGNSMLWGNCAVDLMFAFNALILLAAMCEAKNSET